MRHQNLGNGWTVALLAVVSYLWRRPEVVKGVTGMLMFVGESYLQQYIQAL